MPTILQDICQLFATRGAAQYEGEPVTQLEHALQTAHFAEQARADDELVTACLLHDLGHLLLAERDAPHCDTPTLRGIDDCHQRAALPYLRRHFTTRVLNAIEDHVEAKRYLCHRRAGYHDRLSEDSKRSLALQGGVFSIEEATAFMARPGARDAIALRVWDDRAKRPGLETPPLAHFLARSARCAAIPT
ncbi:MAG: phosphonate degradation HD-domain oxygenase [Burkholderiales bacterium]